MKTFALFACCMLAAVNTNAQTATYKEQYRPQFHFSPAVNWTNDPNGLVFYRGAYHLFYQYNPFENKWGHMSWGHAISKDMVHWQHLPVAIPEDKGVMIFSGSCVADNGNTTGFAKPDGPTPLVAVYTGNGDAKQAQYLAYSFNGGDTWKKYWHNPVLDVNKKDFRDPKVFWYAPKQYWVMAVMLPVEHKVEFYRSANMLTWNLMSEFGPAGDVSGVWECPDIFQVPVDDNTGKKKWMLTMSTGNAMQYFVGDFDGVAFHNQNPGDKIYRPDDGPDYYAGISYTQVPGKGKPVMVGWANNWNYAGDIPTTPWKGAMALPRQLALKNENGEWLLMQQPVAALAQLRGDTLVDESVLVSDLKPYDIQSTQFEMLIQAQPAANSTCGIQLAAGNGHYTEIGYDAAAQTLYMDRSHMPNQSFNKNFAKLSRFQTPVVLRNGELKLHIFFDNSIIEVFANDGETVMTMQVFPDGTDNGAALFSTGGTATFSSVKIWKMKSAWN